jgi:hypothetical protein
MRGNFKGRKEEQNRGKDKERMEGRRRLMWETPERDH